MMLNQAVRTMPSWEKTDVETRPDIGTLAPQSGPTLAPTRGPIVDVVGARVILDHAQMAMDVPTPLFRFGDRWATAVKRQNGRIDLYRIPTSR